jgi:hypothetical protein
MGSVGPSGTRWLRVAGAMLALILLGFQAQPAPREANVRLGWRPGWTETGITVAPGETLTIRVRTIRGAARQEELVQNPVTGEMVPRGQLGPEPEPKRNSLPGTLLKAAARQVIVGRIGEGNPFVVGRRYRQVTRVSGALSLRWNVPREMAASERGFDVAIRVEPVPVVEKKPDEPGPVDKVEEEPERNTTVPKEPVPDEAPPAENESVADPVPDQGNAAQPEQNVAAPADPEVPVPPVQEAAEAEDPAAVAANGPEAGLSGGQLALIGGGVAALLLVLAAAGVGVQRLRRRKLVNRTRSMLALSPRLDLGEGACRGGSLPADGPAASLRARLEEGAIRSVEGGEDG